MSPAPVRFGVVVFPGSNCDADSFHAVSTFPDTTVQYLWHKDTDLKSVDAVILPGGFSYGDYLRCGAIARFSPVMSTVIDAAVGDSIRSRRRSFWAASAGIVWIATEVA